MLLDGERVIAMIALVRVSNVDTERLVSRRLSALRAQLGVPVAPVLDRGGLLDRILTVLRDLGRQAEVFDQLEFANWPPMSAAASHSYSGSAPVPGQPDVVIASPGIDADVLALAAGLCGSPVLPLAGYAGGIEDAGQRRRRTALLLLNPDATPAGSIIAAVQLLEQDDFSWGMLYASDALEARFVLLKALLVDRVPGSGRFGFMSSAYAPSAGDGAPKCLRPSGSPGGREFFEARHDVLFMSGHANALEASVGEDVILCARQGRTDGAADLLPCFTDGVCFRQPATGSQHDLLDARRAGARVLVMSGCNLLPLGQSWFATSSGLVQQAAAGSALAVIAASVASVVAFELDLLCLALMAEGLPLGEVVSELNRVRREVLQHSTGLPAGIGPFVLMGNPALRVDGLGMETIACEIVDPAQAGGAQLRIAVRPPAPDPNWGALLRCEMPPRAVRSYLEVEDEAEGVWCRGVQHEIGRRSVLYLWLGGEVAEPLLLAPRSHDPWLPVRGTIDGFWAELFFWMQFLDCYRKELQTLDRSVELLDAAGADLPAFARRLAGLSAKMHCRAGEVASRRSLFQLASAAWREFALWSDTLLMATVEAIVWTGRVHSYGASPFYRLAEGTHESKPCLCPGGVMTGQIFRSPDSRLRRVEYQCGICGASADEDGRTLLRLVRCPTTISVTDRLSVECEGIAPEETHLHVHAMLVMEPWATGKRTTSRIYRNSLAPDEEDRFQLEMELPEDLTEGAYPISVVAVVNGALYILRRMLQVRRQAP